MKLEQIIKKILREEQENIFVPHNLEGREQQKIDRMKRLLRKKVIDGNLDLRNIPITSLGNVEVVNGNLYLGGNKTLKSLGKLKRVEGSLGLPNTNVEDLGSLEYVGDALWLFENKTLKSLGNLKRVEGYLDLTNTNVEDFGNLEYLGRSLWLMDSKLQKYSEKEIKKMITVKGFIYGSTG